MQKNTFSGEANSLQNPNVGLQNAQSLNEPFEVVANNNGNFNPDFTNNFDNNFNDNFPNQNGNFNPDLNNNFSSLPNNPTNFQTNLDTNFTNQNTDFNNFNNNYLQGNTRQNFDYTAEVQKTSETKKHLILPIILFALSFLFFTLAGLTATNLLFKNNVKNGANLAVLDYQKCVENGGLVENNFPKKCFLNDVYYFENITNVEEYKKNLENEGVIARQDIFRPKNYAQFDKIIDSKAKISRATAYTLKENNQLTYKMEVYDNTQNEEMQNIQQPENAIKIENLQDLKGYENATAFVISPKNAILGDLVYVEVYANSRNNQVILSAPIKGDEKIKNIGQICLDKKYEVNNEYQDNLQKCFIEEFKNHPEAEESAQKMAEKLLDIFQL